jgi:methylaspartate ammonia-lyase
MIVLGMGVSHAQIAPPTAPACRTADCGPQDNRSIDEIVGSVASMDSQQIEDFVSKIENTVDKDKLLQTIQKAVDQNAQIRNLVSIIQQYGVLTEIIIREVDPENDNIPAPRQE